MNTVNKIILIIVLFLLFAAILYTVLRWLYFRKHEHFQCPDCGFDFKYNTFKLIISGNLGSDGNSKILKCPHCGKKECMKVVKDQSNDRS